MALKVSDINTIDEKFKEFFDNLNDLSLTRKDSHNKVAESIEDYSFETKETFINNLNDLYSKIHTQIQKLLKVYGLELNHKHILYKSFDDAKNRFLNINKEINLKEQELNKQDFSLKEFSYEVNGGKIIVNGEKFKAPSIPNKKEKDLINSESSIKIALELIDLYSEKQDCIKYLQDNCNEVFESIEKKLFKDKEVFNVTDALLKKEENEVKDSFKKYYASVINKKDESYNACLKYKNEFDNFKFDKFNQELYLGDLKFNLKNYVKYESYLRKINDGKFINKSIETPFTIDLLNKGNILIDTSLEDENVSSFIDKIIIQFLNSSPFKKTNLYLCDLEGVGAYSFNYKYPSLDTLVHYIEENLEQSLKKINSEISDVQREFGKKNLKNIFEYNKASKETTLPINLVVIAGYPKFINSNINSLLKRLINQGNSCGYYFVIVNNTSNYEKNNDYLNNDNKEFIESIRNKCLEFHYNDNKKEFSYYPIKSDTGYSFDPLPMFNANEDNIKKYLKNYNDMMVTSKTDNTVYLNNIISSSKSSKPYYEELSFPVGKSGNDIIHFNLNGNEAGQASAIIAGTSGSGKSKFLHNIILSAAYNYSPEELEFYLIDFKDGVEFSVYKDKKDLNIPHISFISLENKPEDALDILNKIKNEKTRRNELFKKAGNFSNLKSYEESSVVKEGKFPHLKRLIVIIDEYQNFLVNTSNHLNYKCQTELVSLLKEIRSTGISIILSSQDISIDSEGLNQIYNRYLFESDGKIINKCFADMGDIDSDKIHDDLSKDKGLVYRTNDRVHKTLFKASFTGETNGEIQKALVNEIRNKYPEFESNLIVSRNENQLPVYESKVNFNDFTNHEDDNNFKLTFGQSALSDDLISIKLSDSDFNNYLIVGDIKKARNIETSLGLSFLSELRKKGYNLSSKSLYYFDLNNSNYACNNKSIFESKEDEFKSLMSYVNSESEKSIYENISSIYEEFNKRKGNIKSRRNRNVYEPMLIILNSYSSLKEYEKEEKDNSSDDLSSLLDSLDSSISSSSNKDSLGFMIKKIYTEGFKSDIFMIIHDEDSKLFNDSLFDRTKVICLNSKESANCFIDSTRTTYSVNDLHENYVLLYPDCSKVRPFIYGYNNKTYEFDDKTNDFIDSFIKELKNE